VTTDNFFSNVSSGDNAWAGAAIGSINPNTVTITNRIVTSFHFVKLCHSFTDVHCNLPVLADSPAFFILAFYNNTIDTINVTHIIMATSTVSSFSTWVAHADKPFDYVTFVL